MAYLSSIFLGHLKRYRVKYPLTVRACSQFLTLLQMIFSQEQEKPEPMTLVFCDLDFFAYVFEKVTLRSKAILTECGYLTSVFKM